MVLTIVLCNIPVLVYLLVVSEISKLDSGKNIVSAAQKAEDRLIMDTKKDGTFFTWANQWPGRSRAQLQKRYQSSKFSLIEERTTLQEYGVFFCFLNVLSTTSLFVVAGA